MRCRSLRTPANILVANLAVSDCLLVSETSLLIYNSLHQGPMLGQIGCQVYGFVGGLTGTASICTLTFIALDRYHVIVYPLDARRRTSKSQALLYTAFVWLYSGAFSVLPLADVGLSRYVPEGFLTSCSFDYLSQDERNKNFIVAFFVAAWVLPFCIISFCYTRICLTVLKARSSNHGGFDDSSKHCKDHEKHKMELKLASVVMAVVGLWFASWTPYAVVALLGVVGLHRHVTPLSSMLPAAFCKTASCVDPFVYAVTHPRFRRELLAALGLARGDAEPKPKARARRKKCRAVGAKEKRSPAQLAYRRESDVEEEIIMVNVLGCGGGVRCGSTTSSSPSSSQVSLGGAEGALPQRRPYLAADARSLSFEDASASFALPSWFVSPKPRKNRSTSLRCKEKQPEDDQ